jgi:hypothetical protein
MVMNKGFWIYWYNPTFAKTGCVEYTTTSTERAVELFYRDYSEDYEIVNIHN